MQIDHLLVEEISIDQTRKVGLVKSTLYDFRGPQWVSTHPARPGRPLGPVTLIRDRNNQADDSFKVPAQSSLAALQPLGQHLPLRLWILSMEKNQKMIFSVARHLSRCFTFATYATITLSYIR